MNKPERIEKNSASTAELMQAMGKAARAAARELALASTDAKNAALRAAAQALRKATPTILAANAKDIAAAREAGRPAAFVDRLMLDEARVAAIAKGLDEIAELPDPVGTVLAHWTRPNGLDFERVRVPLGVIGIIYESRPNVTADAGALALKAGNAAILRGGSESHHSSRAIEACLAEGLKAAKLACRRDRARADDRPRCRRTYARGLERLNRRDRARAAARAWSSACRRRRACPCSRTSKASATPTSTATPISTWRCAVVLNAKMRRTGVCGATETLLVDREAPPTVLPTLVKVLLETGCEVRGDKAAQKTDKRVKVATEADWATEYLDAIIAVKTVAGVEEAIDHITKYGTQHTDAIVTGNAGHRRALLDGGRFARSSAQRLDAVRRRRRIRLRCRDRHRHRQVARARTRRASSS